MLFEMYSIHDKLNGYTSPIPMQSEEVAIRYFKDQILGNPTISNSKEDFTLYMMGTFDTETGAFTQNAAPKLIKKATDY